MKSVNKVLVRIENLLDKTRVEMPGAKFDSLDLVVYQ